MVKASMNQGQDYFSFEGNSGNLEIPKTQRALIFQGGGALGAYEVGAFESIYNHLRGGGISDKNMFDIVAGVSAGAINAAFLVDYYLKNGDTWNRSPDLLKNIWRNPSYQSGLKFNKIYQIGCGAVGSSLDYLFTLTDWKGDLFLIDFDKIEPTDCNRSLIFSCNDSQESRKKIDKCHSVLKSSNMNPISFQGDYSKFIGEHEFTVSPPDLILCLANDRNIWATIQNNLPPIVMHATTTQNWGINFGRHIPKKEWCIMCRFSSELNRKYIPVCSEGVLNQISSESTIDHTLGVLPFLSTMAAILIIAEMEKMNLRGYPINQNFITFSSKSDGVFLKSTRKPSDQCICRDQTIDVYLPGIKNTKFWSLTED